MARRASERAIRVAQDRPGAALWVCPLCGRARVEAFAEHDSDETGGPCFGGPVLRGVETLGPPEGLGRRLRVEPRREGTLALFGPESSTGGSGSDLAPNSSSDEPENDGGKGAPSAGCPVVEVTEQPSGGEGGASGGLNETLSYPKSPLSAPTYESKIIKVRRGGHIAPDADSASLQASSAYDKTDGAAMVSHHSVCGPKGGGDERKGDVFKMALLFEALVTIDWEGECPVWDGEEPSWLLASAGAEADWLADKCRRAMPDRLDAQAMGAYHAAECVRHGLRTMGLLLAQAARHAGAWKGGE